jgi:hypothetical protein
VHHDWASGENKLAEFQEAAKARRMDQYNAQRWSGIRERGLKGVSVPTQAGVFATTSADFQNRLLAIN